MPPGGRGVSVEMKQRRHVKNIMISDQSWDQVLFEGNLGQLIEISMGDGSVFEVKGINGILRVDVTLDELEDMIKRIRSFETSGSSLWSQTKM